MAATRWLFYGRWRPKTENTLYHVEATIAALPNLPIGVTFITTPAFGTGEGLSQGGGLMKSP